MWPPRRFLLDSGRALSKMARMKRVLSSVFALMLSLAWLAAQPAGADAHNSIPPVAKKIPKELCIHGCTRVDNYFWLRDKTNPDVLAYLNAENAYADAVTAPQEPLRASSLRTSSEATPQPRGGSCPR